MGLLVSNLKSENPGILVSYVDTSYQQLWLESKRKIIQEEDEEPSGDL